MKYIVSLVIMAGIAVVIGAVKESDAYAHYTQTHGIQTRVMSMPTDWRDGQVGTCRVLGTRATNTDRTTAGWRDKGIISCFNSDDNNNAERMFEVRYSGDLLSTDNTNVRCTRRVDYFWCESAR